MAPLNTVLWSRQQRNIFDFFRSGKGNLCVWARAGTGKTTTILAGLDHAPERKILIGAFNKIIATALTTKLRNQHATAMTLHAIGFKLVGKMWGLVGYNMGRTQTIARRVVENLLEADPEARS